MQKTKLKLETKSKTLEGLNQEQLKAVTHGEGPLLIVAGAGTGKTAVITRRIAYLIEQGVGPEEILAVAFGEKAAGEMEERVDKLLPYGYHNLQISTFHAFGERVLREHGLEIGLPEFTILDEAGQWLLIRNNLDKFDLDYYRPLGNPTRFIRALVSHFSRAKDELITPEEYLDYCEKLRLNLDSAEAGTPHLSSPTGGEELKEGGTDELKRLQEVANAYHIYQKLLTENNALDFGDLINYTLELFRKRPQVLERYRGQFRHILVDEFQDSNLAQYELLKLLAYPKNNLTAVGDDDQSIFKFRGASISNILHFQKDFPQARFVSLTVNYRTGQRILDQAHEFIRQNDPDRLEVRLNLSKKLQNPQDADGRIAALLAPDFVTEAGLVLQTILELMRLDEALTWDDFAILARSHETLEPFINVLEENQIPHLYFANKGLYRKPIILDVLAYFRLLDNYHESAALYRVANFPIFELTHAAIVELAHFAKKKALSLYQAARQASSVPNLEDSGIAGVKKLLSFLDKHSHTAQTGSTERLFIEVVNDLDFAEAAMNDYQTGKYLESFRRRIQEFQARSPDKKLKNFMQELHFELQAGGRGELELDTEAGPEAVKLMTVHGAKGLEFTYVFVVGLVDKRFPSIERKEPIEIPRELIRDILPEGDVHLEEERRLFYVAMTRVKRALYLTRALDYGGKLTKRPSRFLVELGLVEKQTAKPTGEVRFKPSRNKKPQSRLPVPKSFSFTQISVFRKCPLQYRYEHVLKLPAPGKPSFSFGLTLHKTFERYLNLYRRRLAAVDLFGVSAEQDLPSFEELQKIYEASWVDEWYESQAQMKEYRAKGAAILKLFSEVLKNERPRPKYLEQRFRLKLDDFSVEGKIDRADETRQGLLVIDYKTGQPRGIHKVDKDQLLLYQWAAQEFLREQVAELQYWFFWDKLTKAGFLGTPPEIDKLKGEFLETMKQIAATVKDDDFVNADLRVSHDCQYRDTLA